MGPLFSKMTSCSHLFTASGGARGKLLVHSGHSSFSRRQDVRHDEQNVYPQHGVGTGASGGSVQMVQAHLASCSAAFSAAFTIAAFAAAAVAASVAAAAFFFKAARRDVSENSSSQSKTTTSFPERVRFDILRKRVGAYLPT